MPKELEELLKEFNEALSKAQGLRRGILDYIEEHYNIDADDIYYDYLEDEYEWCYGINESNLEELINKSIKGE